MKGTVLIGLLCAGTLSATAATVWRNGKTYDFPIYTNKPIGRQLTGGHAPATTNPLSPEETRRRIQVPPGFEVRLFAAEPEVVAPVAMTWDDRGRLWVVELYEYPKGAPKGATPRDRIKILEDTDADGVADKVTVFADGFNLATGILLGNGGVYVGVAPNLLFLEDTDGDDKADKTTVLKTGFGLEDRHELLNSFSWGPDGWLHMTHGVFTHSRVRDPDNPDDPPVRMDAAVARYHPLTRKFEVVADGTSNPWGVDWNERGDPFVGACVIMHLFHMAPGGHYNRQGGTWPNPFGYVRDLPSKGLPAVVDWRHYRAAHCGIQIYQGDQYPAEWRGLVLLGNIHQNALNCDRLQLLGSTYKAIRESELLGPSKGDWEVGAGNFLVSKDPWVRPVSIQTGPDGALWLMDWYDRYPCYQNAQADPEGVDREHGRIWRIVWVGNQPGKPVPSRPDSKMDLARLPDADLIRLLDHPNNWHRRQAQRLLTERQWTKPEVRDRIAHRARRPNPVWEEGRPDATMQALLESVQAGGALEGRMARLWTLYGAEALTRPALAALAKDPQPEIRAWVARFIGDTYGAGPAERGLLLQLARDPEPGVSAAVAVALRLFHSGSLTVNTPPPANPAPLQADLAAHFGELLARPSVSEDTYYPHIVWMALEPQVAQNPEPFLRLFAAHDTPVSAYCLYRAMRRICDLADAAAREKHLNTALTFLGALSDRTALASAALDGLIKAQETKGAPPTVNLQPIFARLVQSPALADKAHRLASLLGDTSAAKVFLARINAANARPDERLKGVQIARETRDEASRTELLKLIATEKKDQALLTEAVRALGQFSGDEIAYEMVEAWKNFTRPTRTVAADVLVTRTKWARALLAGVDRKQVDPLDISATARRALARSEDSTIGAHAERVLGRYRPSDEDKLKLIAEKRKIVLAGQPDLQAGHEVARNICLNCHKLHGEGAEVGPDLTGVGRSTLDALLHNVIDPNEVIGNGYETTEVELKDGSIVSGRLVEETETRLKLIAAGPIEHAIAKGDIARQDGQPLVRKLELSLMPEGLEEVPDADFRNLIWYILNPPQDNRPWTPALRKELLGDENAGVPQRAAARREHPPVDLESVALWNPDWRVHCPPFEGAPAKLPEFQNRRNVLMTHPIDRQQPCWLERTLKLPAGSRAVLNCWVAAHDRGDWELRVLANGQSLHKQIVHRAGERWQKVSVDVSRFAGRRVTLRLENAANDWSYEFGYWSDLELTVTEAAAAAR